MSLDSDSTPQSSYLTYFPSRLYLFLATIEGFPTYDPRVYLKGEDIPYTYRLQFIPRKNFTVKSIRIQQYQAISIF